MNPDIPNPFGNARLLYPIEQQEDYRRFCQTENPSPLDRSPFPRRVDMWIAAMALAARRGLKPVDLSNQQTVGFVEGRIFDGDPSRVHAIMLTALAIDRSIDVVGDPGRMIAIANGLAAAGAPLIVAMLEEADDDPIWNLSQALEVELSD